MVRDYQSSWRNLINVLLGLTFFGGCFACFIDFDHIPLWVFKITIEWSLPNLLWPIASNGRFLHTLYFWIPCSVVLAGVCSPFLARFLKPKVDTMKKDLQWRKKKELDKKRREAIEYELKLARIDRKMKSVSNGEVKATPN